MNSARISISRNVIIDWINRILHISMTKIEQLGSGVVYCLLLDAAYPYRIPIHKLKWVAHTEVDYIHNFKILQNSFVYLGIDKKIDICRLIRSKYQDNLQFIQWLKWYIQDNIVMNWKQYDPQKRRNYREICLDFYQHKVRYVTSGEKNIKGKDKKKVGKINKNLKKKYQITHNEYLNVLDYNTEGSQDEGFINNVFTSAKNGKTIKTNQTIKNLTSSEQCKQNNYMLINTDEENMINSESCKYVSPKQIKKFYFPERFSLRLISRVNKINGLQEDKYECDRKENIRIEDRSEDEID